MNSDDICFMVPLSQQDSADLSHGTWEYDWLPEAGRAKGRRDGEKLVNGY